MYDPCFGDSVGEVFCCYHQPLVTNKIIIQVF